MADDEVSVTIRHVELGRSYAVSIPGKIDPEGGIEISVADIRSAMYLLEDAVQQMVVETGCPDAANCERLQ